jgi:peptidoglycan/LPS O-acetylase OafA/YrhL
LPFCENVSVNQSHTGARNRALDGLRAVAVTGVVLQHAIGPTHHLFGLTPGPMGVRLFFVLSGFLITDILARARGDAAARGVSLGTVWRAFAIRRALRIFPLAYAAMAVAWVIGTEAMRDHAWWYLLYAGNLKMGFTGRDYAGLGHFWSLAVEEQFYLAWPLVMLWAPRQAWRTLFTGFIVSAFLLRVVTAMYWGGWAAYVLPWSRMDALAFGGLLVLWQPRESTTLLVLAVSLMLVGVLVPSPFFGISFSEISAVVFCGLIVTAVARARMGFVARVLSWRPLVYVGTISYGIYVWNSLVPHILAFVERTAHVQLFPADFGTNRFLVLSVCAVGLASVSWFVLEQPLNNLKRFVPYVRLEPQSRRRPGSPSPLAVTSPNQVPGSHVALP